MKTLLLLLALSAGPALPDDWIPSVLTLTGASGVEELDESELERWSALHDRPLDINSAPRSRLLSCGLFSAWQVASLLDWRSSSGDILSVTELSLVDGFDVGLADALSHFIVLRTAGAPGRREWSKVNGELMLRGALRDASDGFRAPWGIKAQIDIGGTASLFWGSRTTYSDPSPTPGTANISLSLRRLPARVVLGDFSARFGQGLAVWSGFSMSGFSSVQAFRKNGSGIGAPASFTRTFHGVAVDADIGRWVLSAAYSYPSLAMVNATRYGKTATFGTTACFDAGGGFSAMSADWRAGSPSFAWFGEAALCRNGGTTAPAALSGVLWTPVYGRKFSALARWYSAGFASPYSGAARAFSKASDDAGAALGVQFPGLSATFDWAYRFSSGLSQQKMVAQYSKSMMLGPVKASAALRASLRHKNTASASMRTDLRGDLSLTLGRAGLNARVNVLWCNEMAWLWYAGAVWGGRNLSLSARFTLFKVDSWDDRIYCHEPDAPGNFSIPAYYGRGYAISALAGWKGTLFLRIYSVEYPWTVPDKPGTLEARIQWRLRF